jgi:putative tricarboxylic transport membrane protein
MSTGIEVETRQRRDGRRFRIRNPQDFWGGVILVGLAIGVFWAVRDLPGRQGHVFGPGTTPRLLAICLLLMALGIILSAFLVDGEKIGRFYLRGPVLLTAAVLAFAAAIQPLGLVVTTFCCFLIVAAASPETRWLETTVTAVAFTIGAALLFYYGLKLPFDLWPTL